MRFISLFSGIGGLDLGLERAGMTCVAQVEIDDYAQKVLAKHWPDVIRFGDIRNCGAHNLPSADLICGGFPCQDISYAGKGAGLSGARSGLWYEFARIICEVRPRYVLVENVAALLTRGLSDVLSTLASFGYDAEWSILSACAMGAPHTRERVFLVAYDGSDRGKWGRIGTNGREGIVWRKAPEWTQYTTSIERLNQISSWWADEPDMGRVAYGLSARMDRLKGLGNAVVPQVAQFIGERIMEYDRN